MAKTRSPTSSFPELSNINSRSYFTNMNADRQQFSEAQRQIYEMQLAHRDLDLVITHLTTHPSPDQLLLRRLKKRKLQLKDQIMQIKLKLKPDIPA